MLKRRDALYLPGRPKGLWWKWKRDPHIIDAVLMYAQRGHGKRSSFYSDYTFGVWTRGRERRRAGAGRQGLFRLHRRGADRDRPLRPAQHDQPLRPGARGDARARQGPGLEVAFEGLQRSTRHKSGVAMRFPRISRLRWDKPPREADRLETLEKMLAGAVSHASDFVLMSPNRPADFSMPNAVVSRFFGGPPLAVSGPAHPAVRSGRRDPARARLRSRQHHREPAPHDRRACGTWVSTPCAGCGAISCSARSS